MSPTPVGESSFSGTVRSPAPPPRFSSGGLLGVILPQFFCAEHRGGAAAGASVPNCGNHVLSAVQNLARQGFGLRREVIIPQGGGQRRPPWSGTALTVPEWFNVLSGVRRLAAQGFGLRREVIIPQGGVQRRPPWSGTALTVPEWFNVLSGVRRLAAQGFGLRREVIISQNGLSTQENPHAFSFSLLYQNSGNRINPAATVFQY